MTVTVNEKSALYMTLNFKDEAGDALVPSTVHWRLDNLEVDPVTEIVAWTLLPSPAATMNMVIPSSNNIILDETRVRERRAFGVRVDVDLAGEGHQELQYHVMNLEGPVGA